MKKIRNELLKEEYYEIDHKSGLKIFVMEKPDYSGAFAMVTGLILVPLVSLITPKMKKEAVDEIFTCYDKTITTEVKKHLGE